MHNTGQCPICRAGSFDEDMHDLGNGHMCKAIGPLLPQAGSTTDFQMLGPFYTHQDRPVKTVGSMK